MPCRPPERWTTSRTVAPAWILIARSPAANSERSEIDEGSGRSEVMGENYRAEKSCADALNVPLSSKNGKLIRLNDARIERETIRIDLVWTSSQSWNREEIAPTMSVSVKSPGGNFSCANTRWQPRYIIGSEGRYSRHPVRSRHLPILIAASLR